MSARTWFRFRNASISSFSNEKRRKEREDHAYRSKSETSTAVRAERSVEQSTNESMEADISQLPSRDSQTSVAAEAEAAAITEK